jgi:hypothetical protein
MANPRLCANHYFFWRRQQITFQDDETSAAEITNFGDGKSSQQLLAQFKNDFFAISRLRSLLNESRQWIDVSRLTDDQLLAEVARLILSGELGVASVPRQFSIGNSPADRPTSSAPVPAAKPLAAGRSDEPDPATFSSSLNALAQAAALAAAAASGAAFCPH